MRSRARRIQFRGVAENRDAAAALLEAAGDVAVIEREQPRFLVMRCPCGCGADLLANLDRRAGPAWRLYRERGRLTLFPSYWRDTACESHFIIWNDRLFWCDAFDDGDDRWPLDESVKQAVLAALPEDEFANYVALADQLELIPWEVLQACRHLQTEGIAVGDEGTRSTEFRLSG